MKTKLLLTISILLCGQNILYSQVTWQYLNGLSDQYLWKVYAQSPDTVYITGASATGQGMIAKSTNEGVVWTKTFTETNNILKDIVFYNNNIGFVVGENGVILKSSNSGTDWQLKTSGTTQNLNAIALTGLNNIWAVGDGGVVIHSTDEGDTWQNNNNFSTTDNLNDIIFSGNEGYVVGNNASFYKTINAGVIWNKEAINNSGNIIKVQKTENNLYLLLGNTLLEKQNSGSWNYYYGELNGFYMTNDTLGYSSNSVLLTNGGENVIYFNKLRKNDGGYFPEISIYRSWTSSLDINHSDLSVANDTMIYVLSGSVLLKSSPDMTTNLKEPIINKKLAVFQNSKQQNELIVKSHIEPIVLIELFNISGTKILDKRLTAKLTETSVDISHFPVGIYLAKVAFDDKTQTVCKWIKL